MRIIPGNGRIKVMTKSGDPVSPAYARIAKRRISAGNYEAARALREELLEQIHPLRVQVANVLRKTEAATMAPAA